MPPASMLPLGMISLLMLTFSLCDAVSRCTNELFLDPPVVVGEFGESVLVNCSTPAEDYDWLYWTVGKTTSRKQEEPFNLRDVTLSDWDTTAECIIELESRECSQNLEVTVYKNPEMVILSPTKYGDALERTQYELQCDVINVAPVQNLTVRWYRGNEMLHTETFTDTTKAPKNESSILRFTADRDSNGALYRCEAQLDFGPHGSQPAVVSDNHTVSVHYAPEFKDNTEEVYVCEDDFITLICDAEGRPPPTYNWTHDGKVMTSSNHLNITCETNTTYSCTATNDVGHTTKQFHVGVIKRPGAPAVLTTPEPSTPRTGCPLVLTPGEIVVRFGDPASANCSTSDPSVLEMGWKFTYGNNDFENSSMVTWAVETLEDWTITPNCTIILEDNYECSKTLDVTLYKTPDSVTVSELDQGPMLEGREYRLKCDITNVAPVQKLKLTWYRGNETLHTETFTDTTKAPKNESSTLRFTADRDSNGALYRCEAQLDFGPHGSQPAVVSDYQTVSVHYAPEFKDNTEEVYVCEDDFITLICDAEGRPPPTYNWTHDGKVMASSNHLNITCETNITYSCTATNDVGHTTKQFHVGVIKRPGAPAVLTTPEPSTPRTGCPLVLTPGEIVVRFGDPASANCSTSDPSVLEMGWEFTYGNNDFENSSMVTWAVETLEDWTITPNCTIILEDNYECSKTLDVTLYKTPDSVTVSELDQGPMLEGREYRLKCDITNVAPVQKLKLTWYRGNERLHTETFTDTTKAPKNASSTLRFTADRDSNGALYRCEAQLDFGPKDQPVLVTSSPYKADVHYKPLAKACLGSYAGVEHEFSLDRLPCKADGNPAPTVQWHYEGKLINSSKPLTRTQSGEYTATITNSLGRSTFSVLVVIEYGPSVHCTSDIEVMENDTIQCEPDGVPKPIVTWAKDDKAIASPQHWTKNDGGRYSLKATNKHGNAVHTINVDVLYAPVFEGPYTKEVNVFTGQYVTLNCSAEGNPPPDVHWNFTSAVNVTETTSGRQKSLSITGATSTNTGVYICVATNKVGSVRRSITLIVTDGPQTQPSRVKSTFMWVLLVILLCAFFILFLCLAVIGCLWKKHRSYHFVPNKADDSDMPMTPLGWKY